MCWDSDHSKAHILRELLEDQARQAAQLAYLPCRISDEPLRFSRTERFGEFWYRTSGRPDQVLHYDEVASKIVGVLQFTIYTPENFGAGYSAPLAGQLKTQFERCILAKEKCFVLLGHLKAFEFNSVYHGNIINVVDGSFRFFCP